jgi:hypothetical protein
VFPYLPSAKHGEPGHPLYLSLRQGGGRWDNPDLYRLSYLAHTPSGAIAEAFGSLSVWNPAMLKLPELYGSVRSLGVYSIDEEAHPFLDLDDATALLDRSLRPTAVVIRNLPRTQAIAADIFRENRWSGIQWWSSQRPQWTVCALWETGALEIQEVRGIAEHPALADAARTLAKHREGI